MKFTVTFEATGFTDSKNLSGAELTDQEAAGYTDVSQAEGTLPKGVLAVLGGHISEDDGQGESDIHVFVCVDLLVEAETEKEARKLEPPLDLLTKISDLMSSCYDLELERESWEITAVEAELALARERG